MGNKHSSDHPVDHTQRDQAVAAWLAQVRPFDLIVVQGDGVSKLIMKLESHFNKRNDVSHVEVAITKEYCSKCTADVPDHTMLSWGSTMSGKLNDKVNNIETGESRFGVQLRSLEDLAKVYYDNPEANIGVCRLINNPVICREDESLEDYHRRQRTIKFAISEAYDKYNGIKYDANFVALLGSIIPALRPLRHVSEELLEQFTQANSWLFCSEFVALIYQAIGVIDDMTDGVADGKMLEPKDVVPVDFLGADQDHDGIQQPICSLKPIWLKQEQTPPVITLAVVAGDKK